MTIANIRHFGELPSRLHLLSSQTLALLNQKKGLTEFDLMNLNGFYRFLEEFKSSELVDRATTGVLGVERDETFDESAASKDAEVTSESIARGLSQAYPKDELVGGTQKLQQVLVFLAGLEPVQPVSDNDSESAKTALTAIIRELTTLHSQPMHA